jgi:serine/threonine protein kinase
MDLVRGPSLEVLLRDYPKGLPLPVVRTVLQGVLQALAAAHAGSVLHRDLKPGNVLLDLAGRDLTDLRVEDVKVSDFGLSAAGPDVLRSIAQSTSLDRDSSRIVGTLAYMAPEMRDGKVTADVRSDLYAIGVMLFEMLTGERPAGAELPSTLRTETPAGLDDVFRQLYSRHERRYASAEAVLQDLRGANLPPIPPRGSQNPAYPTSLRPPPLPANLRPIGQCGACQRPYDAGDQFCTHCGNQLVVKVRRCTTCGAYPGAHDQYCIFCGAGLTEIQE